MSVLSLCRMATDTADVTLTSKSVERASDCILERVSARTCTRSEVERAASMVFVCAIFIVATIRTLAAVTDKSSRHQG